MEKPNEENITRKFSGVSEDVLVDGALGRSFEGALHPGEPTVV